MTAADPLEAELETAFRRADARRAINNPAPVKHGLQKCPQCGAAAIVTLYRKTLFLCGSVLNMKGPKPRFKVRMNCMGRWAWWKERSSFARLVDDDGGT